MKEILWIVGPQLLGAVFLLAGLIQKHFPPKKINSFYGYRTPLSMKNQESWDEANRYSGEYMIKAGLICVAGGFILTAILQNVKMEIPTRMLCISMSFIVTSITTIILLLTSTERHLEQFEHNN